MKDMTEKRVQSPLILPPAHSTWYASPSPALARVLPSLTVADIVNGAGLPLELRSSLEVTSVKNHRASSTAKSCLPVNGRR